MTPETRDAMLALYSDIDAEGGDCPDEGADFNRGFRVGLELALVKIDQTLNAKGEPDEAWIAEGWARLRSVLRANPAIANLHRLDEPNPAPSLHGDDIEAEGH